MSGFLRKRAGRSDVEVEEPSPFLEMSSVFRIVTLYELLLHSQWEYVSEFFKMKKTELKSGIWFGYLFESSRALIVIVITALLVSIRLSVISTLTMHSSVGWIFYASYMLDFWLTISTILAISIFIQIACLQTQTSSKIVLSASINFLLTIVLLSLFFPLITFQADNQNFIKQVFRQNFVEKKEGRFCPFRFGKLQESQECCGIEEPDDFLKDILFSYEDPISGNIDNVQNRREWFKKGKQYNSIEKSCCNDIGTNRKCALLELEKEEMADVDEILGHFNYGALTKYQLMPSRDSIFTDGCLKVLTSKSEYLVLSLTYCLVMLFFFSAATFGFILVLLLYHGQVGQIVSKTKIYDVSRNTAVHFITNLDKYKDPGFPDDFSLIEFLRETDIDNFLKADGDKPKRDSEIRNKLPR